MVRALSKTAEVDSEDPEHTLRGLRLFENVLKDQVVARLYPPTKGKQGVDALGKPLPAEEGSPLTVNFDKSIRKQTVSGKNYEELVAQMDGLLENNDINKNEASGICLEAGARPINIYNRVIFNQDMGVVVREPDVALKKEITGANKIFSNINGDVEICEQGNYGGMNYDRMEFGAAAIKDRSRESLEVLY